MLPGQIVTTLMNLVHRDPRGFDNPDVFIPDRTPNRHIGMGLGIHRCLGALVPVVTRVIIEEVLRRMPDYELDQSREPVWRCAQISGFESVPVAFSPAGRSTDAR
jgi:cytochrome P450